MKTSKVVSVGMTLVTGVLMLSFQNCGRLNIDVADLAATANKAGGSAADLARDDVKVQIIETSGDVVNVVETIPVIDDAGIITVDIRTDQDVVTEIKDQNNNQNSNQSENQSDQGQQASDSVTKGEDIKKDEVKSDDSKDEIVRNEGQVIEDKDQPIDTSIDEIEQPILVVDTAIDEEIEPINVARSCDEFINRKGATLIDLASFKSVSELSIVKGFTVIFSSNANQYIENLKIDRAVGRTIICGVTVGYLEEKVGLLELHEGAEIKNFGLSKGKQVEGIVASARGKK